ncbi:MAG TPA: AmmeMemoRadiSam system protein A, partial [Candidatus Accumulibacter sp.]|nr:AmmeMemoRadiSam system protein A [Accumulibacter sp.]
MPIDAADRLGDTLLTAARNAIAHRFGLATRPLGELPELGERGAT